MAKRRQRSARRRPGRRSGSRFGRSDLRRHFGGEVVDLLLDAFADHIDQLLDYAAALWGLTLEEFEQNVVLDQDGNRMELRELIQKKLLPTDAEDPESATEKLLEDLRKTLRTGDFELVVAAPTIPEGVQRVMEYLNNRGQRLFGLEVSYFTDEADIEVFVPRLVVRPIPQTEPSSEPVDQETYLQSLPDRTGGGGVLPCQDGGRWQKDQVASDRTSSAGQGQGDCHHGRLSLGQGRRTQGH